MASQRNRPDFPEQLVSFEPDDLQSGSKELAISDSGKPKDDGHHGNPPLDDFQSTSQSSWSAVQVSGPKGIAQALSPLGSTVASTDAVVTADHVVKLESEITRLRKALEAKDIELSETKVHAENYASKALRDSRSKAEQALAFQKGSFEEAHAEYSMTLRDICESEVAKSTSDLEAIANSVIGEQQQELQTASILVSNLQQHLGYAQSQVAKEAKGNMLIEAKAKAEVDAQKASSAQQLSALRVSLENDARASHSKIMNAREKEI